MLKCPYQHIIFTIPHELNYIAKGHPKVIYGVLFRAAWRTIEQLTKDPDNVGGTPGMTAVLHTFGSDLKHHIHLHTLVTFGAVSKDGKWVWPKRKNKIAPYRKICSQFKSNFIKELESQLKQTDPAYYETVKGLINTTSEVRWCVHNTPPTAHTKVIEEYLGRYVCRVGVSNKKIQYDPENDIVKMEYNDYKNQKQGQAAPKAIKHLDPIVAMRQIMIHVLPPNFQKVRSFGIMTKTKSKKVQKLIPELIKDNGNTVRTLFQIVKHLLQIDEEEPIKCIKCEGIENDVNEIKPSKEWYDNHIRQQSRNKSPASATNISSKNKIASMKPVTAMACTMKNY
jgi:Putative transposase